MASEMQGAHSPQIYSKKIVTKREGGQAKPPQAKENL